MIKPTPYTNTTTTRNVLQKGSKSSNQGQDVGYTIHFPLKLYILKTNQGAYSSKNLPEKKCVATCTTTH